MWRKTFVHTFLQSIISYLSSVVMYTKAKVDPLWSPEAFGFEIIFKFFWKAKLHIC